MRPTRAHKAIEPNQEKLSSESFSHLKNVAFDGINSFNVS
jgi:hypothetical protein